MPEPVNVPPVNPPAENKEFAAISDTLGKLNEAVGNLSERLDGFEEIITSSANPPPPPPPAGEEPTWKPKTWDEFPEMAKKVAKQTLEEAEAERTKHEEDLKNQGEQLQQQIDKDFDDQLGKLEKDGVIPPVKDVNNANDAGKQARKELFALGIKYGTPDLVAMANLRNDFISAGYSFDVKEGKLIKSNPSPFGANAPVGSAGHVSNNSSKPTYKEIHGLSMDEMVRRYNS